MSDNGLMNTEPATINDFLKALSDLPAYTRLQQCRDQHDPAGMIEAAVALVLAHEDRPICELVRGDVYRELGMIDKALASYRQVPEIKTERLDPLMRAYDEAADPDAGLDEVMERCMESKAVTAEAWDACQNACVRMEEIHVEAGDLGRAIKVCRTRVESYRDEGDPGPLSSLAELHALKGDLTEAVRWARLAAQEARDSAELWFTLSKYQVEGGRHAEATESLLEAILLDRKYVEAHRLLAGCYSRIATELEGGDVGTVAAVEFVRAAAERCWEEG